MSEVAQTISSLDELVQLINKNKGETLVLEEKKVDEEYYPSLKWRIKDKSFWIRMDIAQELSDLDFIDPKTGKIME